MLTLRIEKYTNPKVIYTPIKEKDKPRFQNGSNEHKEYIYNRSLHHVNESADDWRIGTKFRIRCQHRGKGQVGQLIHVLTNIDMVEWSGLKPRFIELYYPNGDVGDMDLFHPSDLERV
jgi:hypothetical protein